MPACSRAKATKALERRKFARGRDIADALRRGARRAGCASAAASSRARSRHSVGIADMLEQPLGGGDIGAHGMRAAAAPLVRGDRAQASSSSALAHAATSVGRDQLAEQRVEQRHARRRSRRSARRRARQGRALGEARACRGSISRRPGRPKRADRARKVDALGEPQAHQQRLARPVRCGAKRALLGNAVAVARDRGEPVLGLPVPHRGHAAAPAMRAGADAGIIAGSASR